MAALQHSRLHGLNGAASRPTRTSRRVAFKPVASSAFEKVSGHLVVLWGSWGVAVTLNAVAYPLGAASPATQTHGYYLNETTSISINIKACTGPSSNQIGRSATMARLGRTVVIPTVCQTASSLWSRAVLAASPCGGMTKGDRSEGQLAAPVGSVNRAYDICQNVCCPRSSIRVVTEQPTNLLIPSRHNPSCMSPCRATPTLRR